MTTLTLLTGQVSPITFVPAGSRVTLSGSGSVEWTPGNPSAAATQANWQTWGLGSTTGYQDTLRPLCIRVTATASCTVTIEEGRNDKYGEDAYWEEDIPVFAKDSSGNVTGLVGLPASLPPLRAMVIGNSIARQGIYASSTAAKNNGWSAVAVFNSMMGHAFTFDTEGESTIGGYDLIQGVWGVTGATSTTIVASLNECLAAYRPGVVFLHLFENDIINITLAESYANLKTAVNACKNVGAIPIIFTCLPSLSYTTTAHRDYFGQLNDLIFEYCASVAGAIAVDVSGAYIDTTATYPQPLSTYTDASVHPTRKGNALLGDWIYDQISSLFHKPKHRVNGKTDGNALLSVIPNPCMGGTGGTNGTNSSGSVADSWSAAFAPTGAAVVASKVADGTKNSQKLSGTYTGTGIATGDSMSFYGANVTTGFSVGEQIYYEIEVEITGTPVALKAVYGDLQINGASQNLYTAGYQATGDAGMGGVIPVGRMVLRSPIFTIPTGTTGLRPFMYAKFDTGATSASCDLTVHSAIVRKVPFAQA